MTRRFLSIFGRRREISALVFPLLLLTACPDKNGGGIIVQPTAAVTSVSVSPGTGAILVGGTTTFVASVVTTGTAANTVTWTSSNSAIASVNASGNTVTVTGTGAGSATITATSTFDATKSGSGTVTVTAPQTIVLSPSSRTFTATSGGAPPASQTVAVTASSGTINGLLATVSTTSGGNWLSASFTPTSTPSTFTLSANTTNLTAGTYAGTVTIGAPGITTSAVINVTYTVSGGGSSTVCGTTNLTAAPTVAIPSRSAGTLATTDCRTTATGPFADHFRFVVNATSTVQIDMASSPIDPLITLLDANGNFIASDDDGGISTDAQMVRTLAPGTYFVRASSFDPGETGAYQMAVTISGVPAGLGTCNIANTAVLTIGIPAAGALANSDCVGNVLGEFGDIFRIVRTTTATVTVTATATAFDTFLRLLDGNGDLITEDDDGAGGTNSRISRSLAAGTFFLIVTSFSPGETGSYTLQSTATAAGAIVERVRADELTPKQRAALRRASGPMSLREGVKQKR